MVEAQVRRYQGVKRPISGPWPIYLALRTLVAKPTKVGALALSSQRPHQHLQAIPPPSCASYVVSPRSVEPTMVIDLFVPNLQPPTKTQAVCQVSGASMIPGDVLQAVPSNGGTPRLQPKRSLAD
jgi:hypothetical protein